MDDFDWTDDADVAAAIGAQLTAAIALMANERGDATDLINGFLSGRHGFTIFRDRVFLMTEKGEEK